MNLSPIDLGDHLLWPDGTIQVTPEKLIDFTFKLSAKGEEECLSVTEITPEIKQFNAFSDHKLTVKEFIDPSIFPPNWTIPDKYLNFDLDTYLFSLSEKIEHDSLYDIRMQRLADEIFTFKKLNLDELLKLLIYIIDVMKETKSIWGVGRGSSCSSYLLYLMGLHEIDPVLYDIALSDFLKV